MFQPLPLISNADECWHSVKMQSISCSLGLGTMSLRWQWIKQNECMTSNLLIYCAALASGGWLEVNTFPVWRSDLKNKMMIKKAVQKGYLEGGWGQIQAQVENCTTMKWRLVSQKNRNPYVILVLMAAFPKGCRKLQQVLEGFFF